MKFPKMRVHPWKVDSGISLRYNSSNSELVECQSIHSRHLLNIFQEPLTVVVRWGEDGDSKAIGAMNLVPKDLVLWLG